MTIRIPLLAAIVFAISAVHTPADAEGDAKRGARIYGACVACHSLEPGRHLTGPSLAGLWGKKAASVADFPRYSNALKSQAFLWEETTLDAFVADPSAFVAGTSMTLRSIDEPRARADLVAFLRLAMQPGGAKAVVEIGLLPKQFAQGQVPEPLDQVGPAARVTAVRHCQSTFFVSTADGRQRLFWELNLRLKVDSGPSGPKGWSPVLTASGMQGDRASLVFSDSSQISAFIKREC